ncbi:sigma factor-like helix-turn-helix DNA-binding protein [Spirosoma foliorum]|uniref:sigma factor-like helix-turn-helix DNA-binding protein n=1 Tax=Spirosoma foliorum TaxID=2710596 RepID=UPI0035AC245A
MRRSAKEYLAQHNDQSCYLSFLDGPLDQFMLIQLELKYRRIVELTFYGDYTKQEIANQLCLPLGTVKTRYRMALQLLRQQIKQNIHHYHVIA